MAERSKNETGLGTWEEGTHRANLGQPANQLSLYTIYGGLWIAEPGLEWKEGRKETGTIATATAAEHEKY